jgi:hypothetical protein
MWVHYNLWRTRYNSYNEGNAIRASEPPRFVDTSQGSDNLSCVALAGRPNPENPENISFTSGPFYLNERAVGLRKGGQSAQYIYIYAKSAQHRIRPWSKFFENQRSSIFVYGVLIAIYWSFAVARYFRRYCVVIGCLRDACCPRQPAKWIRLSYLDIQGQSFSFFSLSLHLTWGHTWLCLAFVFWKAASIWQREGITCVHLRYVACRAAASNSSMQRQ